jgi:hypothetical protein
MQNPLDEPRFYQNIFIYLYKKILYYENTDGYNLYRYNYDGLTNLGEHV